MIENAETPCLFSIRVSTGICEEYLKYTGEKCTQDYYTLISFINVRGNRISEDVPPTHVTDAR